MLNESARLFGVQFNTKLKCSSKMEFCCCKSKFPQWKVTKFISVTCTIFPAQNVFAVSALTQTPLGAYPTNPLAGVEGTCCPSPGTQVCSPAFEKWNVTTTWHKLETFYITVANFGTDGEKQKKLIPYFPTTATIYNASRLNYCSLRRAK